MDGPTYFSTRGPTDGPIRHRDPGFCIGVFGGAGSSDPIGSRLDLGERPPIVGVRLVVNKANVSRRWACVGRKFVLILTDTQRAESSP